MAKTYGELKKQTVAQLRELAKELDHEALRGYTTMHKEQLIQALCQALGIDSFEHHNVVGVDKSGLKARIRELKPKRDQAIAAHDRAELKKIRREIHYLKRRLRRATV
jgi:DNA-binding IclR family transcriptional regulator